jgi:chemotaxis response regulator CheB
MDTNLHEPERSTFDVQPVGHSAGGPDALSKTLARWTAAPSIARR